MRKIEINPTHDTFTDIMKVKKTHKPLEATYNDEDSGAPRKPSTFRTVETILAEGADSESLLTSETGAEAESENVAEKLYKAKEKDSADRIVRRVAEAEAGWSPKKKRTSHAERVQEIVQERKGGHVEIGEDLIKTEAVNAEIMPEKNRLDLIKDYASGREKYLKNRQKDRKKTHQLGQRQKINDVLETRVESGGEKGIKENTASQRMEDFFDVHRDSLSDGSATLSEEELLRHGRFTALDFFDFADDIQESPNFSSLAKAAGKELQARLVRDSDLAEHFLHMVKRNEAVREIIPNFEELEKIALESVKNPLSPRERKQLEKRYGLVVKEKNEIAAKKGWNEEKLSNQAFFDRVDARTREAYKYEPEKKKAKKYFAQHRPKPTTESRPNP